MSKTKELIEIGYDPQTNFKHITIHSSSFQKLQKSGAPEGAPKNHVMWRSLFTKSAQQTEAHLPFRFSLPV